MTTKLPYYDSLLKALYMHETFGVEFVVQTDVSGEARWHSLKHVTIDPCHPFALKASAKSFVFSQPVNRFYSPDLDFWKPKDGDEVRVWGDYENCASCNGDILSVGEEEGRLWYWTDLGKYPVYKTDEEKKERTETYLHGGIHVHEILTRMDKQGMEQHFFHPDGWEITNYKGEKNGIHI